MLAADGARRDLIEWLLDPSRRRIDPGGFFPDLYDPSSPAGAYETTSRDSRNGAGDGASRATETTGTSGTNNLLGDDPSLLSIILQGMEGKLGLRTGTR